MAVPIALLAAGVGKLSGISLFAQCDYTIHAVAFFVFTASFASYAIWHGSYVTKPVWVNIVSFIVFAISTVSTMVLTTLFDTDLLYVSSDGARGGLLSPHRHTSSSHTCLVSSPQPAMAPM